MYIKQFCFVSGVLLLIAALPMPYGYYMLLRVFITGVVLYCAYDAWKLELEGHYVVGLLLLAALFNPFIPVHFDKMLWSVIDILSALALFWYGKQYEGPD